MRWDDACRVSVEFGPGQRRFIWGTTCNAVAQQPGEGLIFLLFFSRPAMAWRRSWHGGGRCSSACCFMHPSRPCESTGLTP